MAYLLERDPLNGEGGKIVFGGHEIAKVENVHIEVDNCEELKLDDLKLHELGKIDHDKISGTVTIEITPEMNDWLKKYGSTGLLFKRGGKTMRRKPHARGYWKQARECLKKYLLSADYKPSPKVFVYTIPGIMAYSCRPKSKFASQYRLFYAAEGNRDKPLLLTEKDMMFIWDKCWDSRNKEPCARAFNRAIMIFERLRLDAVQVFRRYIRQNPTEYTIDAEETKQ